MKETVGESTVVVGDELEDVEDNDSNEEDEAEDDELEVLEEDNEMDNEEDEEDEEEIEALELNGSNAMGSTHSRVSLDFIPFRSIARGKWAKNTRSRENTEANRTGIGMMLATSVRNCKTATSNDRETNMMFADTQPFEMKTRIS